MKLKTRPKPDQSYNTRKCLINYKLKNLFETKSLAPAPCLLKDRDETKTQVSILNLLILIRLTSVEMVEKAQKDQTKPNLKEHETI